MSASTAVQLKPSSLRIPDLDGKVFLVTGASMGIGAAVAVGLAGQGARVAIHYNASEAEARQVAKAIGEAKGEAFLVKADVTQRKSVIDMVEKVAAHFGRIDGLINNAGMLLGRVTVADSDEDHDYATVDLNAMSVVWACRAAMPWLRKSKGVVINTSSLAARNGGGPGAVMYAASKGFVSTFTRGFAKEAASDGVRVNAVEPGIILTRFHEVNTKPEQMKALVGSIPLGYAAPAEECVGVYLFLASNELSGYITGQCISVNGGQLMP
jgi:3-oxoacyl-[acyl-carrier protein] reductase